MKRALAVLLLGIGIVGIATLAGRRSADERFTAAKKAVDADCRALRSLATRRNADICRIDSYGPKALPLYNDARAQLDHARSSIARGDVSGAESDLARAVAISEDIDRVGTSLAIIVRAAIVRQVLDLAAEHREINATRLLRDVRFDVAKHPFATESLQHRWHLVHWNDYSEQRSRSAADLADALEEDTAAFRAMEEAIALRHDVAGCQAAARRRELSAQVLCEKLENVLDTSARLDAVQHGRLSSASR